MKFGRTDEERWARQRAKERAEDLGIVKFAWRPVKLHDGSWLWWEHYIHCICKSEHRNRLIHTRFSVDQEEEYQEYREKRLKFWS